MARRPRHRPGVRQGQAVSRVNERDVSARALVRATRREGLWRCARRARQDRLGPFGHRRRPDRGSPFRDNSGRVSRGAAQRGVSYIFAGKSELDLALALDILNRELGVKRLLLEGGGGANGAFLRAGLVDELNLILCPAVDRAKGAPSVFDSTDAEADRGAPVTAMTLESSQALEGGAMLLRYRIQNADSSSETW